MTGGVRGGKSLFAEGLAAAGRGPVLYLATATIDHGDWEMQRRAERHQARRPDDWGTLEAPTGIGEALRSAPGPPGTVLVEDLGVLVSNLLLAVTGGAEPTTDTADQLDLAIRAELESLWAAQAEGGWDLVVVTNEVGLGLVSLTPLGRVFQDALGRANQAVASRAEAAFLLVAGIPLQLKPVP